MCHVYPLHTNAYENYSLRLDTLYVLVTPPLLDPHGLWWTPTSQQVGRGHAGKMVFNIQDVRDVNSKGKLFDE